jgi:endonuclease/exonuclease/phosphatase family metal-dependent hydrolase
VIVVHLKAQVDERSESRRRRAITLLDAWLDEHRRNVTENVVLLGDFNDTIDDPPADDVFVALRDGYEFVTQPLADDGGYSYVPFRRLIDHIVVSDSASDVLPVEAVEPIRLDRTIPGYTSRVSDHLPVRSRHRPRLPAAAGG